MAINLRYNYSQVTRIHISLWWNTWWLILGPGSPIHLWGCRTKLCPGWEWASSCGSSQPRMRWWRWDSAPTPETTQSIYGSPAASFTVRFWQVQVIKLCLAFKSSALLLVQLPLPVCNGNKSLTAQRWQGCLAINVVVLRPHLPF